MIALAVAASLASCAFAAWALVVLDLGRRFLAFAAAEAERARTHEYGAAIAAIEKRVERLEKAERQTIAALGGRPR